MKKSIIIFISLFVFISSLTIVFTNVYSKKYKLSEKNLLKNISKLEIEIKENNNKLNEIKEKNDDREKAQSNLSKYIEELEKSVKEYEK